MERVHKAPACPHLADSSFLVYPFCHKERLFMKERLNLIKPPRRESERESSTARERERARKREEARASCAQRAANANNPIWPL